MKLTKAYTLEQEDTIKRNYATHISWGNNPFIHDRYMILKEFCAGAKTILSVGSGGVEPSAIHATHACDVHAVAGQLLKSNGWKGQFFISSCDNIKLPGGSIDAAVCSEVIEHLPSLDIVKNTFLELNRVAKRWMVTTPNSDVAKPENQDKSHIHFWNEQKIKDILPADLFPKLKIYTKGVFIYITKNERRISA